MDDISKVAKDKDCPKEDYTVGDGSFLVWGSYGHGASLNIVTWGMRAHSLVLVEDLTRPRTMSGDK